MKASITGSSPLRIQGPGIWVVCGLPGTGKSTLAARLAVLCPGRHLNTDILRGQMHLRGHYLPGDKEQVYAALLAEARSALSAAELVILDGTFFTEAFRLPVRRLAAEVPCPLHWIELRAPEPMVRQRVSRPRADSEADFDVFRTVQSLWEPIAEEHLVLDSGDTPAEALAAVVLDRLAQPAQPPPDHEG